MTVPGRPLGWRGPLTEVERLEWRQGDRGDPGELLQELLEHYLLAGPPGEHRSGQVGVALLLGAAACDALAGFAPGRPSPVPAVPDLAAVVVRAGGRHPRCPGPARVGTWVTSWSDAEHAAAVTTVRDAIARGELYQANVVGHRSAAYEGDPQTLAAKVAALPGAAYAGVLSGPGWTVASASPEQLVRVVGDRVTTQPVKGTARDPHRLRSSTKDRAEHVMIVDLERNDLARVAVTGSVEVTGLYELSEWNGLWHAGSTVAARLRPDVGVVELLRALAPGGSVTGAPKQAACAVLAGLEPCGRGPAMGAIGFLGPAGLDLGLTIRTVALDSDRVHLWAGGGITWGSDPDDEVAEAHAKAGPVLAALSGGVLSGGAPAQVRPSCS